MHSKKVLKKNKNFYPHHTLLYNMVGFVILPMLVLYHLQIFGYIWDLFDL